MTPERRAIIDATNAALQAIFSHLSPREITQIKRSLAA